jgi:hypothetical protein
MAYITRTQNAIIRLTEKINRFRDKNAIWLFMLFATKFSLREVFCFQEVTSFIVLPCNPYST